MAVSSTISRLSFTGNASTATPYSLAGLRFDSSAWLVVQTIGADGTLTTLTEGVDFSIGGDGSAGTGTLTSLSGKAVPATATLRVTRATPATQTTELENNVPLDHEALETALDKLQLQLQDAGRDLAANLARSIRAPDGEILAELAASASRLGKVVYFNASTGALELKTPTQILALSSGAPADGVGLPSGGTAGYFLRAIGDGTGEWAAFSSATVGLGNVDNTADASKPVSTAQQTALDRRAYAHRPFHTTLPATLDFLNDLQLSYLSPTLPVLPVYTEAEAAGCGPMHTFVMFFPEPLGGWQWWMAYTPLNGGGTEQYENPCIAVSHDGIEWQDHPSITNPIQTKPVEASSWNSDTNLAWIDGRLYIFWRPQIGGRNYLEWCYTEDGETLSAITRSPEISDGVASPSILQEADGTLVMFAVDYKESAPYSLYRWTAPDLATAWTKQGVCTLSGATLAGIWHGTVRKINGKYVLFYSGGSGISADAAFFAESTDGDTFTVAARGVLPAPFVTSATPQANYKPDFIPIFENGKLGLRLYSCNLSDFNWGAAEWGRESSFDKYARIMPMAVGLRGDYLLGDDFTRADGAVGDATSGQTWTVVSGGFSVANNQLHGTSAANNIIAVNVAESDVRLGLRFSDISATNEAFYLVARAADGDFLRFGRGGARVLLLQSVVSGGVTTLARLDTFDYAPGDWLEMELEGSTIRLFANGALLASITSTLNQTATEHGIQCANTITYIDAFYVESL